MSDILDLENGGGEKKKKKKGEHHSVFHFSVLPHYEMFPYANCLNWHMTYHMAGIILNYTFLKV
jgi:hypothetical protein